MKNKYSQAGFTLVELLVVVSLSIMLMLSATALFLTFLVGNTKTNSTQLVKNEGQQAISQIEFLLRNAVELEENNSGYFCNTDMSEIAFKSIDGGITRIFVEEDPSDGKSKIASNSGVYLTSGAVEITAGPTFDCVEDLDRASQYITVSFTLRRGTPSLDSASEIVEETFTTGANLRSF